MHLIVCCDFFASDNLFHRYLMIRIMETTELLYPQFVPTELWVKLLSGRKHFPAGAKMSQWVHKKCQWVQLHPHSNGKLHHHCFNLHYECAQATSIHSCEPEIGRILMDGKSPLPDYDWETDCKFAADEPLTHFWPKGSQVPVGMSEAPGSTCSGNRETRWQQSLRCRNTLCMNVMSFWVKRDLIDYVHFKCSSKEW